PLHRAPVAPLLPHLDRLFGRRRSSVSLPLSFPRRRSSFPSTPFILSLAAAILFPRLRSWCLCRRSARVGIQSPLPTKTHGEVSSDSIKKPNSDLITEEETRADTENSDYIALLLLSVLQSRSVTVCFQ
ncbi:hypothetical protein LINPERHAP1_LOCUS39682, partial [Linum perenne]